VGGGSVGEGKKKRKGKGERREMSFIPVRMILPL